MINVERALQIIGELQGHVDKAEAELEDARGLIRWLEIAINEKEILKQVEEREHESHPGG